MRPQSAAAGGRNNSPSKRDVGPTGDRGLERVYSPRFQSKRKPPQGPQGGDQIFRGAVLPTDADMEGYRSANVANLEDGNMNTGGEPMPPMDADQDSHQSSLTEEEILRIKSKLDQLKFELEDQL